MCVCWGGRVGEGECVCVGVDVALGFRYLLRDISLDQVCKVSVGAATFYVWVRDGLCVLGWQGGSRWWVTLCVCWGEL